MKRRLRKSARRILWWVDGDYTRLRAGWPGLWNRLLLAGMGRP